MTTSRELDARIEAWLDEELDAVAQPQRAVAAAIRTIASTPDRKRRRGIRAWLGRWRRHESRRPDDGTSEVILDATRPVAGPSGSPLAPIAAQPQRVPLALVAAVVGVIAVMSIAFLVQVPGQQAAPPVGGVTHGALTLPPPTEDGREIIVNADGSGHFWTISDAVSMAVDGDDIVVQPGEYRESIHIAGKDVSITGDGGPDAVRIRPSQEGSPELPGGYTSPADYNEDPDFDISIWEVPEEWRYVFYLEDSDARLSGLTVLGSRIGTAVLVDGGAPVLHDLIVDPEGTQLDGDPAMPHEALYLYGETRAMLTDSDARALISILDASAPTLRNNVIEGTCILITGSGTNPELVANVIRADSDAAHCPRFNVAIHGGAAPRLTANQIYGDERLDGIMVLGPETAPTLENNTIAGADVGIWVGSGSRGFVSRNNVSDANTAVKVVDSSPQVDANSVYTSDIGYSIEGDSRPDFQFNEGCGNGSNIELTGDAVVPMALNPSICLEEDSGGPRSVDQ